jgi:hypothetical protein
MSAKAEIMTRWHHQHVSQRQYVIMLSQWRIAGVASAASSVKMKSLQPVEEIMWRNISKWRNNGSVMYRRKMA